MKIRLGRDALAEAVTWAARALPARSPVPVLACLLLTASDGRLTVSGFDYEVSAKFDAEAEVLEPGTVLVSGRLLSEIARSLPDLPVEVSTDDTDAVLTCGASRFELPTVPVEDYPKLPEMPPHLGTIDGAVFASAVAQVAVAAGRDDTLPVLTGVRIEIKGSTLRMVSTDRYRLAVRDVTWRPADPQAELEEVALVPARSLHEIARSLSKGDEVSIGLSTDESSGAALIGLGAGPRRATSRLLGTDFIKYQSVFPETYVGSAVIDRVALLEAAKRVALVTERNSQMRLTLAPGQITVDAGSSVEARGRETLPAHYEGEGICFPANPTYITEGLTMIDAPFLELSYTTPTKPAVFTARTELDSEHDPSYRYLFMPLRSV
ncbi:DNA polymerase III subunit beta [Streptomyces sp. NPDC096323]|uniref:DNA polymerase III subunit beta n=1 Tax=Streptomyces sp. NPDC096323 TaxID=3155822 RepID=UPI0033334A14